MGDAKWSPQEIGLEMDLTVGVLKVLCIVLLIDPLFLNNIVSMTPLKITKAATAHLLFPNTNNTGEYQLISKPIIGAKELSLSSTDSIIMVTNIALAHFKAVKSDNALTDKSMWNLSSLMTVSGIDPSLYLYLSKEYKNSTHIVVFSWIIN